VAPGGGWKWKWSGVASRERAQDRREDPEERAQDRLRSTTPLREAGTPGSGHGEIR
jgi:hypothetical protein